MKKRFILLVIVTLLMTAALYLYGKTDYVILLLGGFYGSLVTNINRGYTNIGTLHISKVNATEEKWRITLNNGCIADNEKKVILNIKRDN